MANIPPDTTSMASEEHSAPPFGDTVIPKTVDSKWDLMKDAKPTSSFVTGNPKPPAPPVGELVAGVAGCGVAVAAMAESAGGIANAAGDIAAAATAAAAEKAAAVVSEYAAKFALLPTTIPTKIAEYTAARVGKGKEDVDKLGVNYNPVKIDLGDALTNLGMSQEEVQEALTKELNEKMKNKKIDETKEKLQKASASAQEKIAKSAAVIGEVVSHVLEGVEWIQQNIDKEVARVEANVRTELETAYKKAEENIDAFAEKEGDKIGSRIVRQYNNTIIKKTKKIDDEKKKAVQKAQIKATAAIQKAKLKIFALVGL